MQTVLWATGFAAVGVVAGTLTDAVLGSRLLTMTKSPLVAATAQFVIGVSLLGEAIALVMPPDSVAPLSDGLLFYWFMESQPQMRANIKQVAQQLAAYLLTPKSAALKPPSTGSQTAECPPKAPSEEEVFNGPVAATNPWASRPPARGL